MFGAQRPASTIAPWRKSGQKRRARWRVSFVRSLGER